MAASSSSTAWRPDVSKDCDIVLNPTNSEKSRSSNPRTASSPGTCTLRFAPPATRRRPMYRWQQRSRLAALRDLTRRRLGGALLRGWPYRRQYPPHAVPARPGQGGHESLPAAVHWCARCSRRFHDRRRRSQCAGDPAPTNVRPLILRRPGCRCSRMKSRCWEFDQHGGKIVFHQAAASLLIDPQGNND